MTAKGTQGWASIAIAALAAGLVVAGLVLAGGPGQARKERRDETRLNDVEQLSQHINCLSRDGGGRVMPADLAETKGCPGPAPLTDTTGAAYRFEPLDARSYRLCAAFELPPDATRARWQLSRRDGDCMIYDLPPPERGEFQPMQQFDTVPRP